MKRKRFKLGQRVALIPLYGGTAGTVTELGKGVVRVAFDDKEWWGTPWIRKRDLQVTGQVGCHEEG